MKIRDPLLTISRIDFVALLDYVEEVDAIIDADDGTLLPLPFLEKHDIVTEILERTVEKHG